MATGGLGNHQLRKATATANFSFSGCVVGRKLAEPRGNTTFEPMFSEHTFADSANTASIVLRWFLVHVWINFGEGTKHQTKQGVPATTF